MEESFSLIVFEEAGSSVLLHDEAQFAAAVAAGRIRPETRLTVYRPGGQVAVAMDASDFPLFDRLNQAEPNSEEDLAESEEELAEAEAPDEAESPAPDSESDPDEEEEVEAGQEPGFWGPRPSQLLGSDPAQDNAPVEPAPAAFVPTPSAAQPSHGVRNLLIVIGVLGLLAYCTRENRPSPADITFNIADNMDAIADNASALADEDPDAGLPMQTFFAVRDVNLQTRAGSSSDPLLLARGSKFTGVVVSTENDPQRKWLKIKQGDNAGRFVWLANLSNTRPPDLDTSFTGFHRLTAPVSLRVGPRDDAASLGERGEMGIGDMLDIAGKVDGDWAEVRLMGGGVAYAPMSAFAEAPQPDEAVDNGATPQNGSTSTPPPPPSGHAILLTNHCSIHDFGVKIYYRSEQGWQTNNGSFWTIGRGRSTYPAIDDAKLLVVSDTIYYAVPRVDGQPQSFTGEYRVRYGSGEIQMRKAEIKYQENGDYEIVLDC